jgi:hypothetical protein
MSPHHPATVAALLISVLLALTADAAIVRGTVSASGGTRLSGKVVEALVVPGTYTFVARTQFTSASAGPMDVGAVSPGPVGFMLEGSARRRSVRH